MGQSQLLCFTKSNLADPGAKLKATVMVQGAYGSNSEKARLTVEFRRFGKEEGVRDDEGYGWG